MTPSRTACCAFTLLIGLWLSAAAVADEDASNATAPAAESESEEKKYDNTLKWSTASEVDNFGYDIYRGDSEEGPFERLNSDPLPGSGTTDEPSHYEYVDDTIDPYATYWYYIESISMEGAREKFTPIFPSKPKLVREGEAQSAEDESSDEG